MPGLRAQGPAAWPAGRPPAARLPGDPTATYRPRLRVAADGVSSRRTGAGGATVSSPAHRRAGVAVLLAATALAADAMALPAAAIAAACPAARFAVLGEALFPGGRVDGDELVLAPGTLAAASGCGTARAAVGRRGGTTRLRARWDACGASLSGTMRGPGCAELRAVLVRDGGAGRRVRRRVAAIRVEAGTVDVVPRPADVATGRGVAPFEVDRRTRIVVEGEGATTAAATLHALLAPHVPGLAAPAPAGRGAGRRSILLAIDPGDAALGRDGYRLLVVPDRVALRAADPAGLVHGVQTLRQLLPAEAERRERVRGLRLAVPALRLIDVPRFPWRGLLFDVSRTFFPLPFVRRLVDLAALYKMSVLHLHLTDDQGWRFESRTHPALHQLGSVWDPVRAPGEQGGFYTQDELRALVDYAAARGITVVPEIEMPGHALAALHALPELACTPEPGGVRARDEFPLVPYHVGPFIHREILCAGREAVFGVLEDVLGEVMDVFPSPWIHVGGDEAPKDEWESSAECQAVAAREGLRDMEHLQAWFTKRIEAVVRARGRRLVGWDEVLDAQAAGDQRTRLAGDTVVMRWRAILPDPPGLYDRDVVFSPFPQLYFDYRWENGLAGAYAFEPAPEALAPAQAARVLGVQANMWTGWPGGRTEAGVDLHVFPRLLAVAETGWTPRALRDVADFQRRVAGQAARLDVLGVAREAAVAAGAAGSGP